ncbi:MAG: choice-of-anchor J domain-containing protein [bacterium]
MKMIYRISAMLFTFILLVTGSNSLSFGASKLAESFTGATFPPTGWNAVRVNPLLPGGDWHRATSSYKSAPGCAQSDGAVLGDNWLMSSQLTPSSGDSLVFWVSSNYLITALGRLDVKVSTTGNAVANFLDFVIPIQINVGLLTPNVYYRHAVSLNDYAGTPIYLAFRHIEVAGLFGAVRLDGVAIGGHDIDLTVLFEGHIGGGFFNTPPRDRDTVQVDVRESVSPFNLVETKKVFLDTLGKKVINYTMPESGVSYYIVVNHRNSISTWSRSGGEPFNGTIPYDFTTGINKAYANNMKLVSGKATIFTGDNTKDINTIIDVADLVPIYNDAQQFVTGDYVLTDLNWDGISDAEDIVLAYNNSIFFVGVETP